jgi:hypothetical protein
MQHANWQGYYKVVTMDGRNGWARFGVSVMISTIGSWCGLGHVKLLVTGARTQCTDSQEGKEGSGIGDKSILRHNRSNS